MNTHLWLPRILGKPPTARRRGTAVRGSGRLGSRALPSPNHSAPCSRPQDGGDQPSPAPTAASARREFEGKPVRVTSGAWAGLGDSSARGATPRERGRREACARRAPGTGRGAGRGWLGPRLRSPHRLLAAVGAENGDGRVLNYYHVSYLGNFSQSSRSLFLPFDFYHTPQRLGSQSVYFTGESQGPKICL